MFETQAPSLYTSIVLAALGVVLILFGRRRREARILSAVLLLVSLNFLAEVMRALLPGHDHVFWSAMAVLALAWDPYFLLLFVRSFPFQDQSRTGKAGQMVSGAFALLASTIVLVNPEKATTLWHDIAGLHLIRWVVIAHLVGAYTFAWALAVRRSVDAPTPLLRQRCTWTMLAIGIATVPRMIQLGADLDPSGLLCLSGGTFGGCPRPLLAEYLFQAGVGTFAMAACYFTGLAPNRERVDGRPEVRRAVTAVAWVALAYLFVNLLAIGLKATVDQAFIGPRLYGLRWIAFGGILLYGILSYEFIDVESMRPRLIASTSGLLGALAIALVAFGVLHDTDEGTETAVVGAGAFGIASSVPLTLFTRRMTTRLFPSEATADRRLVLYRAAVERAFSSGTVGGRLRSDLGRYRRRFKVPPEVAAGIEQLVRMDLHAHAPPKAGDEVLPGIILQSPLGTTGTVFRGIRRPDDHPVVVKFYARGEDGRRRFASEVQALQGLNHGNVARLIDFQATEGRMVVVLEHVDGVDLAQLLRRGRLDAQQALRLARHVLSALSEAHGQGLLHRDIKPSNIILQGDKAWLTDFDAAIFQTHPALERTASAGDWMQTHDPVGTFAYMAPEQVAGRPLDTSTDLYCLGLVLYECLCGRPALDLQGMPGDAMLARIIDPDIDLDSLPKEWRGFLAKALARDPKDRYGSAGEMKAVLPDA